MSRARVWLLVLSLLGVAPPAAAQLPMNIPDVCAGSPDNVAFGQSVTLSGTKDCVGIHGTVTVTGTLAVNTIIVYSDGFLDVQSGGTILFRGGTINLSVDPRQWSQGLIVIGRVRMLGTEKTPMRRVTTAPLAGQSTITVSPAPTGWQAGDEVFIPDTRQADENNKFNANWVLYHEVRTIASINSGTITLTAPLTYSHLGATNADGTTNSAYLPHVANLTRTINLRSSSPNGVRGHTVYTDRAQVEIRNAAFRDLGRTTVDPVEDMDSAPNNQIGRYPVHFHHLRGPVNPGNTGYQYEFTGNVVRDSRKWPVAIHSTHYGLVENNVIYGGAQNNGSGIALEDGSETENMIRGNFVADIRGVINARSSHPQSTTPGSGGECVWGAGFNNRFINNVATGCRNATQEIVAGVGFKFITMAEPSSSVVLNPPFRGAAANEMVKAVAQNQKLLEFDGNEVYGLGAAGLTLWQLGTTGYEWNASQAESIVKDLKVWHVWESGVWLYPTNKVTIQNLLYRYDPAASSYCFGAIESGDYRQVELKVTGGDIHACAVMPLTIDPVNTLIIEDVVATTKEHAITLETPATPGTGASRVGLGVVVSIIDLTITPWPGTQLRTLKMFHNTTRGNNWPNEPYVVNVTEGVSTFRVCFAVQETQNLYGGTCVAGTPRADIDGLISGTAPPSPPSPPTPPVPPTDPPAEVCGNGIDDDRDGSIDEGCTPTDPPPPIEDPPSTPFVLPTLQIIGSDFSISGVETTWNAVSDTSRHSPWNPVQASYAITTPFLNTPNGTYGVAFRVDATKLAAMPQDSSIPVLTFRPEPDINNFSAPVRQLVVYRGSPVANQQVRAIESNADGVAVTYADSGLMSTLASTTTAIVTWTPVGFSLYVNGTAVASSSRTPLAVAQTYLLLAAGPNTAPEQFLRGVTRTPVVYDHVLTSSEITELHTALSAGVAGEPPPTPTPDPCVITVLPTSVAWSVQQGLTPQAQPISVTTSCGAAWQTTEAAAFFDTTAACEFSTCATPGSTTLTPLTSFFGAAAVGTVSSSVLVSALGATNVTIPVTATITAAPPSPPPPEVCGDGLDNDQDGVVDDGCPPPPEICGDKIDNDLDGLVDETCPPAPSDPWLTAPVRTGVNCTYQFTAPPPPPGGNWRAQYFDGATSISGNSFTYSRRLTFAPGAHSVTIRWTKQAQVLTTAAVTFTCD